MARPEAAMEPSMEEILASIRKIIAEEPASSARPRPADKPLPVAPERPQDTASIPAPHALDEEPGSSGNTQGRQPFGPGAAARNLMPPPQHKEQGNLDSSAQATPAVREPRPDRSGATPGTPLAAPAHRIDSPSPSPSARPALSADSEMLFGRLAEALRGGSAVAQASATSPKSPAVPAGSAPDLDDLDDLLAGSAASHGATNRPSVAEDARGNRARTSDFSTVFPRRYESPAEQGGARDSGMSKLGDRLAQAAPFAKTHDAHTHSGGEAAGPTGKAALDDELADLLSEDDAVYSECRASGKTSVDAPHEDVDFINLQEDAPSNVPEIVSGAASMEPNIEPVLGDLGDLEGQQAAQSAFGALMAGLADRKSVV